MALTVTEDVSRPATGAPPPVGTTHPEVPESVYPIATAVTAAPEKAPRPLLAALLVHRTVLLYPTTIVVALPLPPMDTGLLTWAAPMPTPLTLDPERSVLTAVLVALLPYPTTIVVVLPPPPIDTGLLEFA